MKKDHVAAGLVAAVTLGLWANVWAMPTQAELKKAQPLVAELMAPALKEFKAADAKEKAAAAVKVADASAEFAKAAETEAAKFLLLKGAVNFYTRGEEYDKAADAVETLKASVKDVTPAVISEIAGKATGKISETKAPRLFALYRKAKLQLHAASEAKTLAQKLKKVKSDALQRRYAEALAISGDWKTAYAEFAKLSDAKLKAVVEAEAKDKAKNAESGEFWWAYKPDFEEADDSFKEHAAVFYRKALAAGEITGLKKNIVEQRIKEFGDATAVAAVAATTSVSSATSTPTAKSGSVWQETGNEATLDLGEKYGKLEFVKCPAGNFRQLVNISSMTKVPVQITRDFWIMKKPITRQQCTFVPGIPPAKGPNDRDEIYGLNRELSDKIADYLTDAFRDVLPKKMVVRLPTAAEWEYAFHANTRNRKSPFYEVYPGHGDWEKDFGLDRNNWKKLSKPNDWGIVYSGAELLLDKYSYADLDKQKWELEKLPKSIATKELPRSVSSVDPFSWSEADKVVMVTSEFRWRLWFLYSDPTNNWGPCWRFVVGPDLVSEWKAKNGKK